MERYESLHHTKWECKYHLVWSPSGLDSEIPKEGSLWPVEEGAGAGAAGVDIAQRE